MSTESTRSFRRSPVRLLLVCVCALMLSQTDARAVTVNPSGVNVRHSGATTVFLTFRALAPTQRLQEALWCGELNPDSSCVPSTIFGRLPARNELAQTSGTNNVTDIMTIPPSVARRAFQDARAGSRGDFFYVRRFSDTGGAPDEFVAVTCRLGGGGARTPLSLINVDLRFDVDRPVLFVPRDSKPAPFEARIQYNGSGRLRGRWEIVLPGDPRPEPADLLTEATLPIEQRGLQRRYTVLARFDHFLPPTGEFTLPGPDPSALPSTTDGPHEVLLRIEAGDDRESRSDIGGRVVSAGGVAGFPMPTLRYFVGAGEDAAAIDESLASNSIQLRAPRDGARIPSTSELAFEWQPGEGIELYRLEIAGDGDSIHAALLPASVPRYVPPPWLRERVGESLRWRVIGYDAAGKTLARSPWLDFEVFE